VSRIGIATNTPYREVLLVDAAVGLGGQNSPEDVMAVQYLLRVAAEKAGSSESFQPPGEEPIRIDGSCGRQTQMYISFFQAEVNRRQHKKLIEPDGRVDSVRYGSGSSSITHTFYTILALNAALRSRRGDAFHLEEDPLMPVALKSKVFLKF